MAFPTEEGLVRQYTVSFAPDDETESQTVYFTADGSDSSLDYSSELTDQGVAIFVQNPSTEIALTVNLWTTMRFYGKSYDVLLGTFSVNAASGDTPSELAFGTGYKMTRKSFRVEVIKDGTVSETTNILLAMVPANG
jgi:hypothetical protein